MEILIKDVYEALEIIAQAPQTYRVISITSPRFNDIIPDFEDRLQDAREVLRLRFDDFTSGLAKLIHGDFQLATRQDCLQALEFLGKGGHCLVHCTAGVSRSTAIVLGFLLQRYEQYEQAVERLFRLRPCADPNTWIVELMCEILGRQHEYRRILNYIAKCRRRVHYHPANLGSFSDHKLKFWRQVLQPSPDKSPPSADQVPPATDQDRSALYSRESFRNSDKSAKSNDKEPPDSGSSPH